MTEPQAPSNGSSQRPQIELACRHDVPEIIELIRARLPEMNNLLSVDGWRDFYRFGSGMHARDNYFPTVRLGGDGQLLGCL